MQTGLGKETNREFAATNGKFHAACGPAYDKDGTPYWTVTPPTPRQASKFRRKKGAAYKNRNQ